MKKVILILLTLTIILTAGWWRTYGGEGDDYGDSVQPMEGNNYIVVGSTSSFANGDYDLWLLKMDEVGDTIWTKVYGGVGDDYGHSVIPLADRGYMIVGSIWTPENKYDLWLLKTDSLGDTIWTKKYGGAGYDVGHCVLETSDGCFIVVGRYFWQKVWILKVDSLGDTLWTKTYGEIGCGGYDIKETSDGGYIIAGQIDHEFEEDYINGDLWILKTDELGDTLWTLKYDSGSNEEGFTTVEYGYGIELTCDGGYICSGYIDKFTISSSFLSSPSDACILALKTDSVGIIDWVQSFEIEGDGKSLAKYDNDAYVITGSYLFINVLLLKFTDDGEQMWMMDLDGKKHLHDFGEDIQVTTNKDIVITGKSDCYGGRGDLFLLKTDSLGFLNVEGKPPPTHPTFEVVRTVGKHVLLSTQNEERLQLSVFDASGRLVDEVVLDGPGTVSWPVTPVTPVTPATPYGFSPGVYFIRETSGKSPVSKVILLR